MGKILPGPWIEQQKEQTSFPELSTRLFHDLCFLNTEIWQGCQKISAPFKNNGDICPIHCRTALTLLKDVNEKIVIVSLNLRQNPSLACMLSPSRYSLLIDLYMLQDDISRQINWLEDYRVSCLKPSRRLYTRRSEIVNLFEKIIQQLKGLPDLFGSLEEDIEDQQAELPKSAFSHKTSFIQ